MESNLINIMLLQKSTVLLEKWSTLWHPSWLCCSRIVESAFNGIWLLRLFAHSCQRSIWL